MVKRRQITIMIDESIYQELVEVKKETSLSISCLIGLALKGYIIVKEEK